MPHQRFQCFDFDRVETAVGKGENHGHQHIVTFP